MADEQNAESTTEATSQKNPLVAVLLVLNLLVLGVVAFMQYRFMKMEAERPDITQLIKESSMDTDLSDENAGNEVIKKENLLPLEMFTVNLSQTNNGPRRYLRLETVLKMSDEAKTDEFEARKAQIRDTIINILNTKSADDLLKSEGKRFLKEEIKAAINAYLTNGQVMDVFYISFQIN